jgi:hypothetical protein
MASRVCWNCEKDAHQTLIGNPVREGGPVGLSNLWYAFYQCDFCGHSSLGRLEIDRNLVQPAPHFTLTTTSVDGTILKNVRERLDMPDADIHWLPQHASGKKFDDVPHPIADAASEAYACSSIQAHRAAILMARSVVEAVAKDKGIVKGTLADKIDALAKAQHIRPLIQDAAHEIRHLGNDMAHGDFVAPTSEDDAVDVLDFMSVVLAEVYQLPAQLNARQETRAARKAAAIQAVTAETELE